MTADLAKANASRHHLFNAQLVGATGLVEPGGVLIEGATLLDAGPHLRQAGSGGTQALAHNALGALIIPGLVDARVFIGEPGEEHRETLRSISQAAAAGGVTTLIPQPNTQPVIDDPAMLDFLLSRARQTALVHIYPAAALTKGCLGREMSEIGLLKEAGAIALSDGDRTVMNAQVMRRTLTYARHFDLPVMHHPEDTNLAGEGVMAEGEFATRLGLPGIPAGAEEILLERDLRLVAMTGARYHAALLSCAHSVELVRRAKHKGLPVTAGVSIHHLALNTLDIGEYRTFLKLRPPLRSETDRLALLEGVRTGVIDILVSDHNPQDVETKRQTFLECAPGAVGVETLLPVAMRLVASGALPLARTLDALSAAPARMLQLEGASGTGSIAGTGNGRLTPGMRADLALVDMAATWQLDANALLSLCKNTPYDGQRFEARARATLVAGHCVHGTLEPANSPV